MTEVTIIRGFVVLYLGCALFAGVVLWMNAGAPDAGNNAVIAVASVLAVLAAVTSYLVPEPVKHRIQAVLFWDKNSTRFTAGEVNNIYDMALTPGLMGLAVPTASMDEAPKVGLDLLERAVITELSSRFVSSWDIEVATFRGPAGGRSRQSFGTTDNPGPILSVDSLAAVFASNAFAKQMSLWPVMLPPDSKLTESRTETSRTIRVDHPSFALEIRLSPSIMHILQQGVPGVIPAPKTIGEASHYAFIYTVELEFVPSRWRGRSPLMPSYRRWYENVVEAVRTFEWARIEQEIDRETSRRAAQAALAK